MDKRHRVLQILDGVKKDENILNWGSLVLEISDKLIWVMYKKSCNNNGQLAEIPAE